jgi:hypothetical protein
MNQLTFKDFLLEFPGAPKGDMDTPFINSITKTFLDKSYKKISDVKILNETYQLYKSTSKFKSLILTKEFDENSVYIVWKLFYEVPSQKLKESLHNYKNIMIIDSVSTNPEFRRKGIAENIYIFLVSKMKLTLFTGNIQFFSARRMWAKLSNNPELQVDVYDLKTNEIIYTDVKLEHGSQDDEFDNRVWGSGKIDTRLILRRRNV